MRGLRLDRLGLSVWPFLIVTPGDVLGAALIRRTNPIASNAPAISEVAVVIPAGLVSAILIILVSRWLVSRSRSAWWRGVPGALVIYVGAACVSGSLMVALLVDHGPTGQPIVLTLLYVATRSIQVLIAAVVVQQVRDGVDTTKIVDGITQDQLLLARQTNEMIEAAEHDLRAESLRMLSTQVARPLEDIVREAPPMTNADLADRLDEFIEVRLRPLAHVLHPVSVRLGLVSAIRSLRPDIVVDVTATVERMDQDGVLLDEEVRLQVYRWIRSSLLETGASRVALAIRGRQLQVSVHPVTMSTLDAVQAAAGVRELRSGIVVVPLRGQAAADDIGGSVRRTSAINRTRYRMRDLLTVPLPTRLALVTALSFSAAPFQFVIYRWPLSLGVVLAVLASAAAPIGVTVLLDRLRPPSRSWRGACRVLGEWFLIATSSAFALAGVATAFSVFPPGLGEWLLTIPRLTYRYAVPGLLMTVSYGLVVESQRRLDRANDALMSEERRRVEILDKARQLDRDVAEALHRNVQARLAAAVVLLRLDQRQEAWTLVMDMTSVEIPWLLERMGEAPATRVLVPDPPMGLTVIQVDELPVDDGTFDLLTRAVAEIAVNARRHGRASTLVVSLHATAGRWQVTCEDDGTGIPVNAAPGLGSRLLDDTMSVLAGSWTMESSHPGCRITLDFPVRNGPPLHVTTSGRASSGA